MKKKQQTQTRGRFFSLWAKGTLALVGLAAILTVNCKNTGDDIENIDLGIISFRLKGIENAIGFIDNDLKQIIITVPSNAGEQVRDATPEITFKGSRIEPESGVNQDFTRFVNYKVFGKDGTVVTYIVSTRYTDNPAEMTSFTARDAQGTAYSGVISLDGGAGGVISLIVPKSTDLGSMTATIGVVEGYRVETGKAVSPEGTPNTYNVAADDFSKEIMYTVTNGGYKRIYTLKMFFSTPEDGVKKIVAFMISGKQISSQVNQDPGEIAVKLNNALLNNAPSDAKRAEVLSSLTPSIAFVGAKIVPANMTEQDFSKGPVEYKVYASDTDSSPKTYKVTVDFPVYGEDFEHIKLDLASLSITSEGHDYKHFPLSLYFNTNVTEYDVATESIPTAAANLIVGVTPADNGATIKYVESNFPLRAGQPFSTKSFDRKKKNTVTIRVENTIAGVPSSRDYVINIYRGSDNTNLAAISGEPITGAGAFDWMLYPPFDKNTQTYTLLSKNFNWDDRLKFKAVLADENAHLTVDSAPYTDALEVVIPADNSNKIPAMKVGDDLKVQGLPANYVVTFKVTAEDRETVKEYQIDQFAWVNPAHPKGKVPVAGGGTVTYTENDEVHTFEDTYSVWKEVKTVLNIPFLDRVGGKGRALLLGGGGAGGANHHNGSTDNDNGGGGGAGQVVELSNLEFTKTSYDVIVGAGGKQMQYVVSGDGKGANYPGGSGTASEFWGAKAAGGGGGGGADKQRSGYSWNQGGKLVAGVPEGGNGQSHGNHNAGGGGAGAGGAGGNGKTDGTNSYNVRSASGGAGVFSEITGTKTEYGKGGDTLTESSVSAGQRNWGGGNGGNAERYSFEDRRQDTSRSEYPNFVIPAHSTDSGTTVYMQKRLGVSSDGKGDGYGDQDMNDVRIQGGNGVVIVRIPRK